MSRLDKLLSVVDEISTKADTLVNSCSESSNLISLIVDINTSIAGSDNQIDQISGLIQRNSAYLDQFQTLYEKSFLLESNFDLQGSFVNETSYASIYNQYFTLWNQFETENCPSAPSSPPEPAKPLKNMLSISQLNLKPLKCKNTKVAKQKSRYRLSEAYTLNPIQNQGEQFPSQKREVSDSSAYTNTSNIMDTSKISDSASMSSLSEGELEEWEKQFHDSPHANNVSPFFDPSHSPLSSKAGPLTAVCDLDDLDEGLSCLQDTVLDKFENFHHFLRKSRVDLREAFPVPKSKPPSQIAFHNPAHRIASSKHLSSEPTVEQVYSSSFDGRLKFSEHSKKLLGPDHVSGSSVKATTPKKQNHGLFQLLNSPLGSPRLKPNTFANAAAQKKLFERDSPKSSTQNDVEIPSGRRSSTDSIGISLASTFLNLVGTNTPQKDVEKVPKTNKRSPPAKIKQLKRNQNDPIAASNDIWSKRLPVERGKEIKSSKSSKGLNNAKNANYSSKSKSTAMDSDVQTFFSCKTTSLLKDALSESILS